MSNWFEGLIDVDRWKAAWNSVAALYAIQLTSDTFNGLPVTHSTSNAESDSTVRQKLDEYEKPKDK